MGSGVEEGFSFYPPSLPKVGTYYEVCGQGGGGDKLSFSLSLLPPLPPGAAAVCP